MIDSDIEQLYNETWKFLTIPAMRFNNLKDFGQCPIWYIAMFLLLIDIDKVDQFLTYFIFSFNQIFLNKLTYYIYQDIIKY